MHFEQLLITNQCYLVENVLGLRLSKYSGQPSNLRIKKNDHWTLELSNIRLGI
jgi:hypothetical protein